VRSFKNVTHSELIADPFEPGQLWVLGKHRLLCGDSSKAEDVDRLLGGAAIHLVNTDPLYNVRRPCCVRGREGSARLSAAGT
jgi:hypothetical protein